MGSTEHVHEVKLLRIFWTLGGHWKSHGNRNHAEKNKIYEEMDHNKLSFLLYWCFGTLIWSKTEELHKNPYQQVNKPKSNLPWLNKVLFFLRSSKSEKVVCRASITQALYYQDQCGYYKRLLWSYTMCRHVKASCLFCLSCSLYEMQNVLVRVELFTFHPKCRVCGANVEVPSFR